MGPLVRMFGKSMRTQLLEALLELGTEEFTRGELADRRGLHRKNVNRAFESLLEDGFVEPVREGAHPTFRVRADSLRLHLLSQLDSALDLVERSGVDAVSSEGGRRLAATHGQAVASALATLPKKSPGRRPRGR